jgi:hypothetical protein
MIFWSEAKHESKQAGTLQTDILTIFFIVGKCDWDKAKIIDICPPVLTKEFQKRIRMLPNLSVPHSL